MVRKTSILPSLATAVLMLSAVTQVTAQATFPPQVCKAGRYTISTVPNHFPLIVASATDPNANNYPCSTCSFPYYVFEYNISEGSSGKKWGTPGDCSDINKIDETFPVCQDDSIQIYATNSAKSYVYNPGEPDRALKWPSGIYDRYTVSWAGAPSSGRFWLATNTSAVGLASLAVKDSRNVYDCVNSTYDPGQPVSARNLPGGIAGPSCPRASFIPVSLIQETMVGGVCIRTELDPATGCPGRVFYCDTGEEISATDVSVEGLKLTNCGSADGNQRCQTCVIYAEHGSAPCTWYYVVNGRPYPITATTSPPCPN